MGKVRVAELGPDRLLDHQNATQHIVAISRSSQYPIPQSGEDLSVHGIASGRIEMKKRADSHIREFKSAYDISLHLARLSFGRM